MCQGSTIRTMVLAGIGVASFHAAFAHPSLAWLTIIYLGCLLELRHQPNAAMALRWGTIIGLLCLAPQLWFFFGIFSFGAAALWLILAIWIGLFAMLLQMCHRLFGPKPALMLAPFFWLGLEYTRSELYYLRFPWMSPGFAFAHAPGKGMMLASGIYGLGFLLLVLSSFCATLNFKARWCAYLASVAIIAGVSNVTWPAKSGPHPHASVRTSGIQLEFVSVPEVLNGLDRVIAAHPDTELIVLSEYTFEGPVPESVKRWCAKQRKFLVVGGKETQGTDFNNTAFVIGPAGEAVFKQVKAVPIQFFKDGLPATSQQLWESPWGKIGICICYDLNYRKVTDALIKLGAEAILCPTMDVEHWGLQQHLHHARTAPIRSAEYRVPIFKVASSGFSQWVDSTGTVRASAGYPGANEILSGMLAFAGPGRLPLDAWLAPVAVGISALAALTCFGKAVSQWITQKQKQGTTT